MQRERHRDLLVGAPEPAAVSVLRQGMTRDGALAVACDAATRVDDGRVSQIAAVLPGRLILDVGVHRRRIRAATFGTEPELLRSGALITVGVMKKQIAKLMVAVGFAGAVVAGTVSSCDDSND